MKLMMFLMECLTIILAGYFSIINNYQFATLMIGYAIYFKIGGKEYE